MTERDEIAAKVLQGLCANPGGPFQANGMRGWGLVNCTYDQLAAETYELAASMQRAALAARGPKKPMTDDEIIKAANIGPVYTERVGRVEREPSAYRRELERSFLRGARWALALATRGPIGAVELTDEQIYQCYLTMTAQSPIKFARAILALSRTPGAGNAD